MSIRDSHNRKVSFDIKEELGDKIDKLAVMIGKLATRDSGTGRQFKPQIHQSRGRGQNRGNYNRCNCYQWSYQNRCRSDSGDRRQCRQDRGRARHEKFIGEVISEVTQETLTDKIPKDSIETITRMKVMTEAGTGPEKGCSPGAIAKIEIGIQAIEGPGQDQEPVQIEAE